MWSGFRIFINLLTYWKNMTPDYNINIIIIYDYNSMNSVLICFIIFIFNCNNIQDKRVIRISWSDLCRSLRVILHTLWFIIFFYPVESTFTLTFYNHHLLFCNNYPSSYTDRLIVTSCRTNFCEHIC